MNIYIDNDYYIAVNDCYGNKVRFFNTKDYIGNKSRIPLHIYNEDAMTSIMAENTMLGYITQMIKKNKAGSEVEKFTAFILDLFLAGHLMSSALPVKVCEIGSDNGNYCGNIADIIGKFNPESRFCLVCQSIGNDGNNLYLDAVSHCENPSELSVTVTDYCNTELMSDNFDIVIINDSVKFENPHDVVREAHRLVKNGGMLLCIADENSELDRRFREIFKDVCKFAVIPGREILKAVYDENTHVIEEYDFDADIEKTLKALRSDMENDIGDSKLGGYLVKLSEFAEYACKNKLIKHKMMLINAKELLIYYKISTDDDVKNVYKAKLIDFLDNYLTQV